MCVLSSRSDPTGAQRSLGSVTFVIADASGDTIPHAKIRVNHANIKDHPEEIVWKLDEADETGYFTLNLSPGIYDLAVTSPGSRLWTRQIEVKEEATEY